MPCSVLPNSLAATLTDERLLRDERFADPFAVRGARCAQSVK